MRGTGQQLAVRSGQKGGAPEGDVAFTSDAVDRGDIDTIGDGVTALDYFPGVVLGPGDQGAPESAYGYLLPPDGIDLREFENQLIRQAMARANNNQTKAAMLLNLKRDALRYRLEKLGML